MPTIPEDTSPEAYRRQIERWRAMGVAGRWVLTDALCRDVDRLARAGIRTAMPDASEAEITLELVRRRYGDDFAREFREAVARA